MNSLNDEILSFLKKASKRIKANFIINLSIVGLKYLLCLILSLLLISLFVVIPYIEEVSIGILIVGLIGVIIYGFIKAPNKKKVALIVDSKGLKERLTTSLEFLKEEDELSIAQKKDTVNFIKGFNIKEKLKISLDKKQIFIILMLVLTCFISTSIDTTSKRKAEDIREFNKYQQEFIKKVEEEKKKIDKIEDLSKEDKEELKKILEDAKKDLKESEKKLDINKTLERMEKKLDDLKNSLENDKEKNALENIEKNLLEEFNKNKEEEAKKDLNDLAKELLKKKESKDLGEAILSGDKEALEKALANIKKNLGNMNSSELSRLSKALGAASEEMSDEELKEALEEASESVLDGELDTESLNKAIQNSQSNKNKDKGEEGSNSSQGEANGEGQGQSEGEGEGQGEEGGNGEGQGQGSGQGQGQGNQSGSGSGSGWDTGSNEGKENDLDNNKGESIYIPGRNVGDDENLTGNKNQNGESQSVETENGFNLDGEKVDIDKVINDYTNSALDGANNSNLPESLKDIIKNYFEGLN